ncbi:hypothetical protein [Pseudomonas sp. BN415]|uniref:hypothetical protein n=1 Tax=Pseudomonas sp. BN415 TaxID=2567889 RepID=UPI0024542C19|nr:hypothetical protein [Pseudomonas sp. BN415]
MALALAGWVLFSYGVSLVSLLVALLLLACPVFVVWLSLRLAQQVDRDVKAASREELDRRSQSKRGNGT